MSETDSAAELPLSREDDAVLDAALRNVPRAVGSYNPTNLQAPSARCATPT